MTATANPIALAAFDTLIDLLQQQEGWEFMERGEMIDGAPSVTLKKEMNCLSWSDAKSLTVELFPKGKVLVEFEGDDSYSRLVNLFTDDLPAKIDGLSDKIFGLLRR